MNNNAHTYEANPWFHDHLEAEYAYTRPRSLARKLVNQEWHLAEPAASRTAPCRCTKGTLWFKSTIGRHKCDACGTLAAYFGATPEYLKEATS